MVAARQTNATQDGGDLMKEQDNREARVQEVMALVDNSSALAQAKVDGFIAGYAYRMETENHPQ